MNGYDTLSLENIATLVEYHIAILMWLCAIATFCNTSAMLYSWDYVNLETKLTKNKYII